MLTDLLTALRKRLRAVFRPGTADREMTDEIRFHLEMEARKNLAAGMTAAQAERAARLAFGGVEHVKEAVRTGRGFPWLGQAARDLRFSLRGIRRAPGFAAVAVTTLALGIGAATTIFALVDAVFLSRLPFHEPERLVHIWETNPDGSDFSTSEPNYLDFRSRTASLDMLGAYRPEQLGLTGRGEPQLIAGAAATASFFATLGVGAVLGRTFGPDEDLPGAPARVVLLSHAFWQGAFGGDSAVVGQTAILRGEPYTVVNNLSTMRRRSRMLAVLKQFLRSRLEWTTRYAHEMRTLFTERLLNIETRHSASGPGARVGLPGHRGIHTDKAVYDDNVYYEPLDYRNVPGIMRVFGLGGDDVFYDIGCGKGRVLCLVARLRLRKAVGVELFEELCAVARQNARRLRGKKAPIDVICADATQVDYSDGTVFYWWNPFGELTMRAVMKNLRESFDRNPRSIRIGYLKPVHENVLDEELWLERYASIKTVTGSKMVFWRTAPQGIGPGAGPWLTSASSKDRI